MLPEQPTYNPHLDSSKHADSTQQTWRTPESKTFSEENNTLLLNIDKNSIDASSVKELAEDHGFSLKAEHHITAIGFTNGKKITEALEGMAEIDQQKIKEKISDLAENIDWSYSIKPETFHISKDYKYADIDNPNETIEDHRESYIRMVEMPGMKKFYEGLNKLLNLELQVPPPHVTLFVKGNRPATAKLGIGIKTAEELEKLQPHLIAEK